MSVDGSFIMANASHDSRIPREQFREAAQVNYGARKYLEELEQENGDGEAIHQQDKVSTTDPDSTYLTKGNRAAELGYFDNYLIDNESCVIVGVQATAARLSQESAAARDMIDRYCERYGQRPKGVAADNTYGNGEMLQWLDERGITPYIRVKESPNSPPDLYGIEKFTYVPEENCYLCPAGKLLNYVGINKRNRAHRYYSTVKETLIKCSLSTASKDKVCQHELVPQAEDPGDDDRIRAVHEEDAAGDLSGSDTHGGGDGGQRFRCGDVAGPAAWRRNAGVGRRSVSGPNRGDPRVRATSTGFHPAALSLQGPDRG